MRISFTKSTAQDSEASRTTIQRFGGKPVWDKRFSQDDTQTASRLRKDGNHDLKLVKKLRGRDVQIMHGLADSLARLEREQPGFSDRAASFLDDSRAADH